MDWLYSRHEQRLITLSKSLVFLLVAVGRLSPLQSSAVSAIPCIVFFVRGILSESLDTLGFRRIFAPLVILYGSMVNIFVFSKLIPLEKLKKYLYIPLAMAGMVSWLIPQTSANFVGIELKTAMDKVLWIFLGRSLISSSTLLYTLLLGKSAGVSRGMRNMTSATAVTTLLDFIIIRRNVLLEAGFSLAKAYRFIFLSLSTSTLLFLLPST
jgi:hypothetical protein